MTQPELDPSRFDAMVKTRNGSTPVLWGLDAIGAFIGVSPATARRWAREGWPIRKLGGKWCAFKADLIDRMRGKE
ncbi:MAG: DNA-binding protein [Pararhodobacter sp.]|nr:DNA-binding protein [Pararhodobacter sp.]